MFVHRFLDNEYIYSNRLSHDLESAIDRPKRINIKLSKIKERGNLP